MKKAVELGILDSEVDCPELDSIERRYLDAFWKLGPTVDNYISFTDVAFYHEVYYIPGTIPEFFELIRSMESSMREAYSAN